MSFEFKENKRYVDDQTKWEFRKMSASEILPGIPQLFDEFSVCAHIGYSGSFPWYAAIYAEKLYRTFWIDKDTKEYLTEKVEGRRLREITAPMKPLKALQRKLCELFDLFPKHPANFAFMKGLGIKDACERQKDNEVSIAVDLREFFPSHKEWYIIQQLQTISGWNWPTCKFLAKLVTLNKAMPQGTPTSPILSIVLNYQMDKRIEELATEHNLVYSRYADDMVFSGHDRSNTECIKFVEQLQARLGVFELNKKKTRIMRNRTVKLLVGWKYDGDILPELPDNYVAEDGVVRLKDFHEIQAQRHDLEMLKFFVTSKPIYYYVQSIRRMLGLHLIDGVKYPRAKYIGLRREAMTFGLGRHPEPEKFKGTLAYVKGVDPVKHAKLLSIVTKYIEKVG